MAKRTTLFAIAVIALTIETAWATPQEDAAAAMKGRDYATAMQIYRPLAEKGDRVAESALGAVYAVGLGIPRNIAEGIVWFSRAAAQNDTTAQFDLAEIYSHEAAFLDYGKAASLYRAVARKGHAEAQYDLATLYAEGRGVPKDARHAYVWFALAADAKETPYLNRVALARVKALSRQKAEGTRKSMSGNDRQRASEFMLRCQSNLTDCD